MNTPLIIKFRHELNSCRISELKLLFIAFSSIIMVFAYYGLYRMAQLYVSYKLPLSLLVLLMVLFWVVSGLPSQLRIINDRTWINFTTLMPISPLDTIALHCDASLLPALVTAGGGVFFVIMGGGIKILTLNAIFRWLVIIIGVIWVLSLETVVAMIISRYRKARMLLVGLVICWIVMLVERTGSNFNDDSGTSLFQMSHTIVNDLGLAILGITGMINTLTVPDNNIAITGVKTLIHLLSGIALFSFCSWKLALRLPIEHSNSSLSVSLSYPVKFIIKLIVPGAIGGGNMYTVVA